jgi:DNA polymerase IV
MSDAATLLHADLDAFYASVEQLLYPGLRNRPIAVGGGVVLAASYEAKAFGVRGGMPGHLARRLCPELRFVPGHFAEYQRLADRVFAVCADFTPLVERLSIDEAFVDVSGSTHLFGPADLIAARIRERVREEIGLPLSVGVARTKHLAKIASQVAKPDGLIVVAPERETGFLHPLPVGLIWGVGPVARERLADEGITTIGQLAAVAPDRLEHMFGPAVGAKLGSLARNDDPRRVETRRRARSVSAQSATGRRRADPAFVARTVLHLADRVTARLRAKHRAGRTITARVRFADLHSVTRSVTLPAPVSSTATVAAVARDLVQAALTDHPQEREVSLLAVAVSGLVSEPLAQPELPFASAADRARAAADRHAPHGDLERAVDRVRERFGRDAVGYASVELSGGGVPDRFRELAEREI